MCAIGLPFRPNRPVRVSFSSLSTGSVSDLDALADELGIHPGGWSRRLSLLAREPTLAAARRRLELALAAAATCALVSLRPRLGERRRQLLGALLGAALLEACEAWALAERQSPDSKAITLKRRLSEALRLIRVED